MNVIDLLEEQQHFVKQLEIDQKSFNTIKNYRTDLNCFNKYLVANGRKLILTEFTFTQVKEYSQFLEKSYNSPNSIRRRVQALRIFFDFLKSKGIVDDNPVKRAIVSAKVVDKPNPTLYKNIIRLEALISETINSPKKLERLSTYRNLVVLQLIFGAGLKVSDIALLSSKSIFKLKDGAYRVMVSPTRRDPYTITLPDSFEKLYIQYQALLEKQKNIDNIDFDNLFYNGNPYKILSGGLSPRGIEILFKELSRKLEVRITAKSLRQACIFKWINFNHKDSSIKEWMGVQPQYSLKPFHELIDEAPDLYTFIDLVNIGEKDV